MRLIFLLLWIGLIGSAHAASREEYLKACDSHASLAETIMEARQQGLPMPRVMKIVGGDKLSEHLVSMAYDYPRMRVKENQAATVSDFQSKIYKICFDKAPEK